MVGGMRGPSIPPVHKAPRAKALSYPYRRNSGSAIFPTDIMHPPLCPLTAAIAASPKILAATRPP